MRYKSEKEMYPDVCQWLQDFLTSRFQSADVDVYDLSRTPISRFLRSYDKGRFPSEQVTWDIQVDVVGFIHHPKEITSLAFVECKNTSLTLAHLSQLLGYSRIAQPLYSFLISPSGFSSTLVSLLQDYQRRDVLEYHWEQGKRSRQIVVAEWDIVARNLNRNSIIGGIGL
jgi:hypothetical protein